MKTKQITLSFILCLATLCNKAQVILKTTVASGNFNNPAIWSPPGVPTLTVSAYNLVINHNVSSTLQIMPSDSVIINSSGSLSGYQLVTKKVVNRGAITFTHCTTDYLNNYNNAVCDTMIVAKKFVNNSGANLTSNRTYSDSLLNHGNINSNEYISGSYIKNHAQIATVLNASFSGLTDNLGYISHIGMATYINKLLNQTTGKICAGILTSITDTLVNHGKISGQKIFQLGTGTISATGVLYANDTTYTSDLINHGDIFCAKFLLLTNDYFTNNGNVITTDLYNTTNIKFDGFNGKTCLSGQLFNAGIITGTMDVCDASPNTGDLYGLISTNVTQCTAGPCTSITDPCLITTKVTELKKTVLQGYVYPNPAIDNIQIVSEEAIKTIKIYTISGELVKEFQTEDKELIVPVSDLQSGLYFVELHSKDNSKTIKLIKN